MWVFHLISFLPPSLYCRNETHPSLHASKNPEKETILPPPNKPITVPIHSPSTLTGRFRCNFRIFVFLQATVSVEQLFRRFNGANKGTQEEEEGWKRCCLLCPYPLSTTHAFPLWLVGWFLPQDHWYVCLYMCVSIYHDSWAPQPLTHHRPRCVCVYASWFSPPMSVQHFCPQVFCWWLINGFV